MLYYRIVARITFKAFTIIYLDEYANVSFSAILLQSRPIVVCLHDTAGDVFVTNNNIVTKSVACLQSSTRPHYVNRSISESLYCDRAVHLTYTRARLSRPSGLGHSSIERRPSKADVGVSPAEPVDPQINLEQLHSPEATSIVRQCGYSTGTARGELSPSQCGPIVTTYVYHGRSFP